MSFVARWLQRNREGIIVPQFYNRRIDDFEAQEGESGASLITGMRSAWREDFPGEAATAAVYQAHLKVCPGGVIL